MDRKEFRITKDINLLWIAEEEEIDKFFVKVEGLPFFVNDDSRSLMIEYINESYGIKIKDILFMHRNIEKLGYNIFYKE